jgi:N-acetylgalactosamine kinase
MTPQSRIDRLIRAFARHYGREPSVVADAPGRVNLIGEHTDYNGLPVLPMAIERTILIAGAPREDRRVELANVDPAFPPRRYELAERIAPFAAGDWGNYNKAAAQGLLGLLGASALHGGEFLVEGNIPHAAGLSSSAALVVASALALLEVNECEIAAPALAELMASAERYVGTLSGGMDQAVCLLAQMGHALRIDFEPLRTRPVRVPPGYAFVVCDSLVAADKSGAARAAYNHRVIECRLACRVLGRVLGVVGEAANLGALRRAFPGLGADGFVAALAQAAGTKPSSIEDVARVLEISLSALAESIGAGLAGGESFKLVQRTRHVLTEADRVRRAEAALQASDWEAFAALMNASHASCRDDYEISCPELEELVGAARAADAIGARLTGAGFGGCTVNLVPAGQVDRFLGLIDWAYYRKRPAAIGLEHCFVFQPSAGATVLRVGTGE